MPFLHITTTIKQHGFRANIEITIKSFHTPTPLAIDIIVLYLYTETQENSIITVDISITNGGCHVSRKTNGDIL